MVEDMRAELPRATDEKIGDRDGRVSQVWNARPLKRTRRREGAGERRASGSGRSGSENESLGFRWSEWARSHSCVR